MERSIKSALGVTLIEVALVLVVAAFLIVMSVRYYKSTNDSAQANALMNKIQSITSAADSLSISTGSYSTITQSALAPILPGDVFTMPGGGAIAVNGNSTGLTIIFTLKIPQGVCILLLEKLSTDNRYSYVLSRVPISITRCVANGLQLNLLYKGHP